MMPKISLNQITIVLLIIVLITLSYVNSLISREVWKVMAPAKPEAVWDGQEKAVKAEKTKDRLALTSDEETSLAENIGEDTLKTDLISAPNRKKKIIYELPLDDVILVQ